MTSQDIKRDSLKIAISAGEVSGDAFGAHVLGELKKLYPEVKARGMGGPALQNKGCELIVDAFQSARVMGFFGIIKPLKKILGTLEIMKEMLKTWKPDVLLVIDYPDFNLRLAKYAKTLGIKVIYFIPPKVWAWRRSRIKLIAKVVDRIAAIFPFEPSFFSKHGYERVCYVGHPLLGLAPAGNLSPDLLSFLQYVERESIVLVMSGSRPFEVTRFLPKLLDGAKEAFKKNSKISVLVSVAPGIDRTQIEQVTKQTLGSDGPKYLITDAPATQIMPICRAGILKSGTCNLEAALLGLPFVSVYQADWITKTIVKTFVNLREYSPVNIITSGTVREIMKVNLDPAEIADEIVRLLEDDPYRRAMIERLADIQRELELGVAESPYKRVAGIIQEELS